MEISRALASEKNISPVIPVSYLRTPPFRFDFSKRNPDIMNVDMTKADDLQAYIDAALAKSERTWGMGGYGEDRFFYEKSELFKKGNEYRSIHLGLDIWLPAGTEICAPLDATVHSFQYNGAFLDYGSTIILRHEINNVVFYTLYGHQSRTSLAGLAEGRRVVSGEKMATLGIVDENGHWPPHLHLQIIGDLFGQKGDYPGVSIPSERDKYLGVCPAPELLLKPFLRAQGM
jgi:murein DD-endopeptidase MepM/ murein hydrolase activator NlpD